MILQPITDFYDCDAFILTIIAGFLVLIRRADRFRLKDRIARVVGPSMLIVYIGYTGLLTYQSTTPGFI